MGPQHVRCGMPPGLPVGPRRSGPSMGPQHVRCGMRDHPGAHAHSRAPSMGPQHVRCGMPLPARTPRRQSTSFNGAATCSLRNEVDGLGSLARAERLQWGRNMFVAECHPPTCNRNREPLLQWGRNMFVAECLNHLDTLVVGQFLQWGRNMFVAECRRHCPES